MTMASTTLAFNLGPSFLTASQKAALEETAAQIATPGKGITACDEGPATIGSRFEKVGIANSEETRRKYRQMLFTFSRRMKLMLKLLKSQVAQSKLVEWFCLRVSCGNLNS